MGGKKGKKWSNYSNPIILQTIKELIITKNITLGMNKVAAHQGDMYNERADILSKQGTKSKFFFEINQNILREQKFQFKVGQERIDTSIKDFIKKSAEIEHTVGWFMLNRNKKWLNKNIMNETNWKLSKEIWMGTKITSTKTDTNDDNIRTFAIKLLNEELPTLTNLNLRKPDTYKEKKCFLCNRYNETNAHIFLCDTWKKEFNLMFMINMGEAYKKEEGPAAWKKIKPVLNSSSFLKKNIERQLREITDSDRFGFDEIVKGLIPKTIYKIIRKTVNSMIKAKEIIRNAFISWKNTRFEGWKERCKNFIKWENDNNIDEKEKRGKGGRNFINYDYIEQKKLLKEREKNIIGMVLINIYKCNSDITTNLLYCID
jgi:hypothetical protein